ncbi:hypothetical protein [Shewanella salipaludis]|uniref:Uncharacterized protein n=1 Tax=Shewanella salipaludis TaxID=2723052 RepID=A0A972FZ33_9GAMM|nr:hypothetical protein [Shewanella salipaludis]NMH65848.1 hypothetical protein [Shewanella salipaludis]
MMGPELTSDEVLQYPLRGWGQTLARNGAYAAVWGLFILCLLSLFRPIIQTGFYPL